MSTISIWGLLTNSSSARAKSALATSPLTWALLPWSSLKVSKMPNVAGPILKANQAVVPTSAATRGGADLRNCSTSASLPCRACSVASIPTLFIRSLLFGLYSRVNTHEQMESDLFDTSTCDRRSIRRPSRQLIHRAVIERILCRHPVAVSVTNLLENDRPFLVEDKGRWICRL